MKKGVLFCICDWDKPLTGADLRYLGFRTTGLKGWWNYFKPRGRGAPVVRIYLAPEGKHRWTVTLRQDKTDLVVLNSLPAKLTKKHFQNLLNSILGLLTWGVSMVSISNILQAMRADAVPAAGSGRWIVKKQVITVDHLIHEPRPILERTTPGEYTYLFCLTMETMMSHQPGEVVMNDLPHELRKHLQFILQARGKVLVGGLGLGCVVRGLLAAAQVESIDLIERSEHVIKLCGDSVADPRVRIHKRDALNGIKGGPWQSAWWDLWADPEKSEPHLAIIHIQLIDRYRDRCPVQGAWALPRWHRRALKEVGVL